MVTSCVLQSICCEFTVYQRYYNTLKIMLLYTHSMLTAISKEMRRVDNYLLHRGRRVASIFGARGKCDSEPVRGGADGRVQVESSGTAAVGEKGNAICRARRWRRS